MKVRYKQLELGFRWHYKDGLIINLPWLRVVVFLSQWFGETNEN